MKCPKCGGSTAIYGTKAKPNGTVLRYRRCLARGCWLKFHTREEVVPGDGHHVPLTGKGASQGRTEVTGNARGSRSLPAPTLPGPTPGRRIH